LIEWGFANYKTIYVPIAPLPQPRIWKGTLNKVNLAISGNVTSNEPKELLFTADKNRGQNLQQHIELFEPLIAPIDEGTVVGQIVVSDEAGILQQIPLTAKQSIPKGNIFKRIIDSVLLGLSNILKAVGLL
jgi:D-alanyl-D-alanine carboxypeptidase (penicillin-binding protein 5/6)